MSDLGTIIGAVKTKVESRAYTFRGQPIPILARKAPRVRKSLDPTVQITVSKSTTAEPLRIFTFQTKRIDYLVDVTLVTPYDGPDADLPEYCSIRDDLLSTFARMPLEGAPQVFNVNAAAREFLVPPGVDVEWDWQRIVVSASVVSANVSS